LDIRREIWYASIGENIGFEEDGKGKKYARPVLILKVFNRKLCCIIPLSTTSRRRKFYYPFNSNTGKTSVVLFSQVRVMDSSRLKNKIGFSSKDDFIKIKEKLRELLKI
jgi:mRNA interferase MazF